MTEITTDCIVSQTHVGRYLSIRMLLYQLFPDNVMSDTSNNHWVSMAAVGHIVIGLLSQIVVSVGPLSGISMTIACHK